MKNILAEIYQHKQIEVRNRKKTVSLQDLCTEIKCLKAEKPSENRNFFNVLKEKDDKAEIALICEIKKASPSKGIIREDFNPVEIAKIYEASGASCISVLTDEKYFMGANQYLSDVRKVTNLPILRKDFIIDPYQIYEAKALGADCILLIVAMLEPEKLLELEECALSLGLSVLIEIHDEAELKRALNMKSKLIGINNRNLKTMEVDLKTSLNLADLIPNDYVIIGESGIKDALDIELLQQAGINCFLIGEHFMKQKDIAFAIKDIFGE